MCVRINSEDPFSKRYVPDQYKTQQICDEAVDYCLAALRFVPELFVKSKMLEKFDNASHGNNDIIVYNEYFDKITFTACQIHVYSADIATIKLDNDHNFYENSPDTIVHVRVSGWRSNLKNPKHLKKDK